MKYRDFGPPPSAQKAAHVARATATERVSRTSLYSGAKRRRAVCACARGSRKKPNK